MAERRLLRVRPRALFALALAMGGASSAQAQQAAGPTALEAPPVTLPGTEQHDLVSTRNGQTYRLYVSLPEGYVTDEERRYPVLYLLDGHLAFPAAVSALASMAIQNEVEDVVVVGIGYGEHAFDSWFTGRWRDFTPSVDAAADSGGAAAFSLSPETVRSGGASEFLDILQEEILPLVEERYRVSGDRGLAGHSLGGLFAAYALFEAPGLFTRYGLSSPSLWWGGGEIFEREEAFSVEHRALSARLLLSVGSEEGGMVTSMQRLAQALRGRGYEGLFVEAVVFEGESHGSVVPATVARTLRALYGPPGPR